MPVRLHASTRGDVLGYLAGGMSSSAISLSSRKTTSGLAWLTQPNASAGLSVSRRPDPVRLLFDEQLSEALCDQLRDAFPGSVHIRANRGRINFRRTGVDARNRAGISDTGARVPEPARNVFP